MGSHALVLNASFEPLNVVSWQKAIQLLFQGKVEVVEESDWEVHTVTLKMRVPLVLRLLSYVAVPQSKQLIKFSRANVFVRDQHKCQYCGKRFSKSALTLDHVLPVVQGGQKNWTNIVTSCRPCNQRKGGRTPEQAGMRLIRQPKEPRWLPTLTLDLTFVRADARWRVYLE